MASTQEDYQEKSKVQPNQVSDAGGDSDDDGDTKELGSHFNKFQLLDAEDEAISDGDEQLNQSEEEQIHSDAADNKPKTPTKSSKANRSKKRNKKKSTRKQETNDPFLDDQLTSNTATNASSPKCPTNLHLKMLKLDLKYLNPENELKRLFGRGALEDDRDKDKLKGWHKLRGQRVQRSRFASAGYSGPVGSVPKMELDTRPNTTRARPIDDDIQYFKFVHDKLYQTAQSLFTAAVQTGQSEAVIQNLNLNPTHVESLLVVSDMMFLSENYQETSSLIERALLIFEREFHPKFTLMQADCRLVYERPENRTFFITLFKHIISCSRRGLRRTPLEYTKLLLSLEPDNDPLFAALFIDFFAIRSEEYDFLIDFVAKWPQLAKLPNLKLSLALAYFMKSQNSKFGRPASESNLTLADESIQEALLRYPNFIVPLLEECSTDLGDYKLACVDYFDYSVYGKRYETVPESVQLLISIYVKRTGFLWKVKPVMAWLERNFALMASKFSTGELRDQSQNLELWHCFRGPVPRNLLRHVVLSDLKVKIPPSVSKISTLDIDPYPPTNSIISYSLNMDPQFLSGTAGTSGSTTTSSSSFGIPGLFLLSLLPSFSQTPEIAPSDPSTVEDRQDVEHEFHRRANMLLDQAETPAERQNVLNLIQNILRRVGLDSSQADDDTGSPESGQNLDRGDAS